MLIPVLELEAVCLVVAVIRARHGRVHGANVVLVRQVPLRFVEYFGNGVFAHQIVQRDNLVGQIKRQIRRILQKHRAHDDLERILVLNGNQIRAVGARVNSGPKRVLHYLDIGPAKEQAGQRILFPDAVQRVAKRDRFLYVNAVEHCKLLFCGRGRNDVHATIACKL